MLINFIFKVVFFYSNHRDICKPDNRVHSRTWKRNLESWRFQFHLSRSRNSLEFAPKSSKTCTKRYPTYQYYIETFYFKFCIPAILECRWQLLFSAKSACTKTWRIDILTWKKPGDNLEFFGTKMGNCDNYYNVYKQT